MPKLISVRLVAGLFHAGGDDEDIGIQGGSTIASGLPAVVCLPSASSSVTNAAIAGIDLMGGLGTHDDCVAHLLMFLPPTALALWAVTCKTCFAQASATTGL